VDPLTIGLAFTAAQSAVSHIKQAIALGKDINGLVGQFSRFFDSADSIHRARISNQVQAAQLGKTDAELGRQALELAMHSDALRQQERELKDMIIWQLGKPQIWEDMIRERTRLFKARAEAQRLADEQALAHSKKTADQIMTAFYFVGFAVCGFCLVMCAIGIYSSMEEQRVYQEKVSRQQAVKQQRVLAAARVQREEALAAVR
jgi:hypothetical protein